MGWLQSDNLLLDGPLNLDAQLPLLKVADFGLSKQKWSVYVTGVRDLRYLSDFCSCTILSGQLAGQSHANLLCWSVADQSCVFLSRYAANSRLSWGRY